MQNTKKTKTKVKQNELLKIQLDHIFDDSKFIFICKEQEFNLHKNITNLQQ
jgi:hypothetical protein